MALAFEGKQNQVDGRSLIFVYGSLKRGFALHRHLVKQAFVAAAATQPSYRLFDCGEYPAMVKVAVHGRSVKGEVFSVHQECLLQLDEVEGVKEGLYSRDLVHLCPPFETFRTFAWFFVPPTLGLSDCGSEWPIRKGHN
ncbi:MAG TPA: gamma-glutamylcyclotransferase [Planctomycetes bacterium]|nr:gamma-glutamylcyclotransferase [Fuerstiella sp.]HIK93887.1 gamma-glutamylcyclotransferase [Planctomycetota bacterium]